MKRLVSCIAFIMISSSIAYADGGPSYAGRSCCAPFSWTGFYVGGSAGWGTMDIILPPAPGTDAPPTPTGGLWGGQIGANYQFARHWVIGAEVDGALARLEDSHIRPDPLVPLTLLADTVKVNAMGSVRGRLGVAWDRTLFYATAGWAWGAAEVTTSSSNAGGVGPQIVTDRVTTRGWTVGGGVETALWGNWTAKLEYQFTRNHDVTVQSQGGPTPNIGTELQTVRIGVNYLFR